MMQNKKQNPEKQAELPAKRQEEAVEQAPAFRPFSRPSRFAFVNRLRKNTLESYRELIKAETELLQAMGEHAKEKDRLQDVHTEIAIERKAKRNLLRELDVDFKELELREKELELKEQELELKTKQLRKAKAEPERESYDV